MNDFKKTVLLNKTFSAVKDASNKKELLDALSEIGQYDKFSYNYILEIVMLLICGVSIFFSPLLTTINPNAFLLLVGCAFITILCIFLIIIIKFFRIGRISKEISHKAFCLDNDLVPREGHSETYYYNKYKKQFSGFNLGEKKRRCPEIYNGKYTGPEFEFKFEYYVFSFVTTYDFVETDNKGKKRKKKIERTHFRYGLILNFPFSAEIQIIDKGRVDLFSRLFSRRDERWDTNSKIFDKELCVFTKKKVEAAKFLSPVVVLEFQEILKYFKGLSFEVNSKENLNIQFDNDNLMTPTKTKYNLKKPKKFVEELSTKIENPLLDAIMTFVHKIKKFNDSNF